MIFRVRSKFIETLLVLAITQLVMAKHCKGKGNIGGTKIVALVVFSMNFRN